VQPLQLSRKAVEGQWNKWQEVAVAAAAMTVFIHLTHD
jgi:hypothetical protein